LPAKRAYHHGNLRAALIAAALRELSTEGLDGISLRGVARRAGVSAPAVYRHFEDKDALLAAVAAECAERLGATMVQAVAEAPDDPLERFRATGIASVRFAVAYPEHYRALSVPGLSERTPPEQRTRQTEWQDSQRRALADAQARGQIAPLPLDDVLLAANALVGGLAHMITEGRLGKVDDARATELAIAATSVLGIGLVPRAEPLEDSRPEACRDDKRAR
jgi:AcrR family transcriptional regulator